MFKASAGKTLWYTAVLGAKSFLEAMLNARYREQYEDAVSVHLRAQETAGLDICTDGDAHYDEEVGGMSWQSYPLRHMAGFNAVAEPAIYNVGAVAFPRLNCSRRQVLKLVSPHTQLLATRGETGADRSPHAQSHRKTAIPATMQMRIRLGGVRISGFSKEIGNIRPAFAKTRARPRRPLAPALQTSSERPWNWSHLR